MAYLDSRVKKGDMRLEADEVFPVFHCPVDEEKLFPLEAE
jgi:hypothetical protein